MQTFLPYPSFVKSAKVLDYRRLGKQRVEAWQIYKALMVEKYGWRNHPIVKMWKGYEAGLLLYGIAVCLEWKQRGYNDSMLPRFLYYLSLFNKIELPPWLGDSELHSSHRSNLLRKDISFYSKFNWKEDQTQDYKWIIKNNS